MSKLAGQAALNAWFKANPVKAHVVQPGQKGLPNIKNIIVVASGKGGVGKSTTSVNLALALVQVGKKVGLLDADIHGPNHPMMLHTTERLEVREGKQFVPVMKYGLASMSIGYLIPHDTPIIWRGPMISQVLHQLLYDTVWGGLDYLLVDLPPGTGDIPLTLAKKIPLAGVLIVTTPQQVAKSDAKKALRMFEKLNVTVLGIIENMARYVCPHCQHESFIFGEGAGDEMALEHVLPVLGQVPLVSGIRESSDKGVPVVIGDDVGLQEPYFEIAWAFVKQLSKRPVNHGIQFPNIVVEGKA